MKSARRQRGISVITAIFLIVVLAALGAFLVTVSGLQQTSSALDIQGSKAYQASRAGIEWGAFQALRNGSCAGGTFVPGGTLTDFTVTVTCVATPYSEVTASTGTVYLITSTACNRPSAGTCPNNAAPGQNYVERQLQATMAN
ncbi:MAG TPA: agglutinin biogenesis protein MshP [Burkholderiales bacterium]